MEAISIQHDLHIASSQQEHKIEQTVNCSIRTDTDLRHQYDDNDDEDDDDCVICYLTMYRPVKTVCGHSACEACMLHWAMSAMERTNVANVPELGSDFGISLDGIKFMCPTCRTYTQATLDVARDAAMAKRYPDLYTTRAEEIDENRHSDTGSNEVDVTFMIGNSHQKVVADTTNTDDEQTHEWSLYVKCTKQEIVDRVEVVLPPRFRGDRLVSMNEPPFSVTQVSGQRPFDIFVGVVLKAGWQWNNASQAVDSDSEKGRVKDRLPLRWKLHLESTGSFTIKKFQVKRVDMNIAEDQESSKSTSRRTVGVDDSDKDILALAGILSEVELLRLKESRRYQRSV